MVQPSVEHLTPKAASLAMRGLTDTEAARLRGTYGPNAVAETRVSPLRKLIGKFWGPVPWMLEGVVVMQVALGRYNGGAVIFALLIFNAVVALFQETRAGNALALLERKLQVQAKVHRDGIWRSCPAIDLVPGDIIHLRAGDVVPADARVVEGAINVDQSALTGESLAVSAASGATVFTGSLIKQGEATCIVTATGPATFYGKTFGLVQASNPPSHMQQTIYAIVKRLMIFDAVMVVVVIAFAIMHSLPLADTALFAIMLLVASVPAALPATYTLATATASSDLAHRGVLVSRLPAIEEAAAMDILISDKTGTLTQNALVYAGAIPLAEGYSDVDVLVMAARASDPATLDALDTAIIAAAVKAGHAVDWQSRTGFIPFDPLTRFSAATFRDGHGDLTAIKGAASAIAERLALSPSGITALDAAEQKLTGDGARVLAVAAGPSSGPALVGVIGLADPPRTDAAAVLEQLRALGVRVVMATGDSLETAKAIGRRLGLGENVCTPEAEDLACIERCDIFARVLPVDKHTIVKRWQEIGHVVGMTGDGVNDAPALKQAELGIAVASATDAAKAAAGAVLTDPGLGGVVAVVGAGREVYRRMLTYTLNKIIKTLLIVSLLTVGLFLTGGFVISSTLVVLLLFTNDFMTMAIAGDRVVPAGTPQRWNIDHLTRLSLLYALPAVAAAVAAFWWVHSSTPLSQVQMETVSFLILVFFGQSTLYALRTDGLPWDPMPGRMLVLASVADMVIVVALAAAGWLMASVPLAVIATIAFCALGLCLALSAIRLGISARAARS